MKPQTVVVGGGAVGLSLAWELARRGTRVHLLERERTGRATSWAASGILPPANLAQATDPIDQLRGLSHQLFPLWTERLQAETSIDTGFRRCGGWYLADTPGERAAMLGMTLYWDELGIACQGVPLGELAAREPALGSWATQRLAATGGNIDSAWWTPDECQLRPPRYLQALAQACQGAGVEVVENATVRDIRSTASAAAALVGDRWYEADSVVVCGGAWTGQVAAKLQLEQAIVPIRGQILLLKSEAPLFRGVINLGHRYLLCRDDGYTLVGSCEEEAGFHLATDEATLQSLFAMAIHLVPGLRSARRVAAWSGLRPMTFDGFPMIGRVPDTSNVYVAAGHFRSGLHLSPGTAVVLADLIEGTPPAIGLDAFKIGKQQSQLHLT